MEDNHWEAVYELASFMIERIHYHNAYDWQLIAIDVGTMYTGDKSEEVIEDAISFIADSVEKMINVNNAAILKNLGYTIH